jgi:hypothetical protein
MTMERQNMKAVLQQLTRTILLALLFLGACLSAAAENHSDIWWNPAESGRGLVVIDHETDLFVIWCTYSESGLPTWFVIPGGNLSADRRTFEGGIYQTHSDRSDLRASAVSLVGTATLDFAPEDLPQGWARYTIRHGSGQDALVETRALTRQPFGTAAPAWGSDATDMWWDSSWPGWGIATIQHGSGDIFSVMLHYDYLGNPTFSVFPSRRENESQFDGTMYRTRALSQAPFDPSRVSVQTYGSAFLQFSGAAAGPATRMRVIINEFEVDTTLERQPFGRPLDARGIAGF